MKSTFNFIDNTVTTDKGSVHTAELYTLLLKCAQAQNIESIHIICKRVNSTLIRYCKFAMFNGKLIYFNGREVADFDAFRAYQAEIADYFLFKDYSAQAEQCLNLIFKNRELLPYYRKHTLEEYLQGYIRNSGYDVSMSSASHRDKPQHTKYTAFGQTTEYDYDYVRHATIYVVSLYDLLNMYVNVKWYIANGFAPEIVERSEDTPTVVPFSACEKGVGMYVYSD